jgi:hypothetical protein
MSMIATFYCADVDMSRHILKKAVAADVSIDANAVDVADFTFSISLYDLELLSNVIFETTGKPPEMLEDHFESLVGGSDAESRWIYLLTTKWTMTVAQLADGAIDEVTIRWGLEVQKENGLENLDMPPHVAESIRDLIRCSRLAISSGRRLYLYLAV